MPESKPIALQLYSVRDALSQDFEGTMQKIANMGYIGVEPYGGLPYDLSEAAILFKELGLEVFNSHVGMPEGDGKDAMLKLADAFGLSRVAVAYLPDTEFDTIDKIKVTCERLNQANAFAKDNGIELGYHNHWWEFKTLDGQETLDVMLDELDKDIFFEVDTYWVKVGGLNPVEFVESLGDRAPLLHLKDGPLVQQAGMTAVGSGKMPIPELIKVSAATAEWYIVELDRCDTDMMTAVQDSYSYLTSNQFAKGKK